MVIFFPYDERKKLYQNWYENGFISTKNTTSFLSSLYHLVYFFLIQKQSYKLLV